MTVRELVAALQAVDDQDLEVWLDRYNKLELSHSVVASTIVRDPLSNGALDTKRYGREHFRYWLNGVEHNHLDTEPTRRAVIVCG